MVAVAVSDEGPLCGTEVDTSDWNSVDAEMWLLVSAVDEDSSMPRVCNSVDILIPLVGVTASGGSVWNDSLPREPDIPTVADSVEGPLCCTDMDAVDCKSVDSDKWHLVSALDDNDSVTWFCVWINILLSLTIEIPSRHSD